MALHLIYFEGPRKFIFQIDDNCAELRVLSDGDGRWTYN